jgi:MFS family permease
MSVGVIYDLYGRRKPFLAAWILACLATFVYPFVTNKYLYYVVSVFLVPLTAIFTIPFIPDLIMEES